MNLFKQNTQRFVKEQIHPEYTLLQATWNESVIKTSLPWMPTNRKRVLSLGAFIAAMEMSFKDYYDEIICVDHESYLPNWKPSNVSFHQADLDSSEWALPENFFDVCFMNEIIEHFLWSPIPLLKWVKNHSSLLVISTPDDAEWPPMTQPWSRYQHFSAIPSAFPGAKGNPKPMFHTKQYKQAEFIELLDFCGFRLVDFCRVGEGHHQMLAICTPRSD